MAIIEIDNLVPIKVRDGNPDLPRFVSSVVQFTVTVRNQSHALSFRCLFFVLTLSTTLPATMDEDNNNNQDEGFTVDTLNEALLGLIIRGQADVAAVEFVLRRGALVNFREDATGYTPLLCAARQDSVTAARALIHRGALLETACRDGCTPLWVASAHGNIHVARLLITHGANVQATGIHDATPLFMACQEGHTAMVRLLLEDDNNKAKMIIDQARHDGVTPLMAASLHGHAQIDRLLLDRGACVDRTDNLGNGALWSACQKGHDKVVRILLEAAPNVHATW